MSTSISIKELKELDPSSYQIVDIRDAVEISHGAIPGALAMKTEEIETSDAIDRTKRRSSAAAVAGSVWQPQKKQDRKKKFIHVQKNRRNAGAEDFQPSGHLQPV